MEEKGERKWKKRGKKNGRRKRGKKTEEDKGKRKWKYGKIRETGNFWQVTVTYC
jgi:hypothetical protein